jgi:hypothetical protein
MVEVSGDRTADLLHAMQALSQLSYTPLCLRTQVAKLAPRLIHQQKCRCVTSNT